MTRPVELGAFKAADKSYIMAPKLGGYEPFTPYNEVSLREGLMPIAEDTTLSPTYYEDHDIDTRYPRDARRSRLLASLSELEGQYPNTVKLFSQWGGELKSLAPIFEPQEGMTVDNETIAIFLKDIEQITTPEEILEHNLAFYGTPRPLRFSARADMKSYHDMLRAYSQLEGVNELVDATPVAELIDRLGINDLEGEDRIAALKESRALIEELIRDIRTSEAERIEVGDEDARQMQSKRIFRRTHVADSLDNFTYKQAIFNGVIADPGYLLRDESYELIREEPEVQDPSKIAFFKHVMAGSFPYGHDHTYLYRSLDPNIAASHDGVIPDYGVVRPGNFVFHDLKLIEHGPHREGFPLDALHQYFRLHYLEKVGVQIGADDAIVGEFATFGHITFDYKGQPYAVPLERLEEAVLPFRALKKDLFSDEYFEYGTDCYLAELVDMALQFDKVEQKRGTAPEGDHIVLGGVTFDHHVRMLMQDMLNIKRDYPNEIATVIEQLLFMKGKLVEGGHEEILRILNDSEHPSTADISSIPTVDELTDTLNPVGDRQPLTCYYEWFQRYARPVAANELTQKGIQLKPALFQRGTI
jgi:hypothetical protein